MMTASPDFRPAQSRDLADVRALLEDTGLPFEDLGPGALQDFIVLRSRDGDLIAAGGLERYGPDALLRSVVVRKTARGAGLGETVVLALERHARASGVKVLYLLTTTAAAFFPRLGYVVFDRAAVPAAVSRSTEFASLCPDSAVCLKKNLE